MKRKRTRMLTPAEEREMFDRYLDQGDLAARDALLLAHKPMAVKAARAFASRGTVSLEDLCQEAYVALAQAIAKFDRSKNVRLSTFAAFYIKAGLMRYVMDSSGAVRVGTNFNDKKVFANLRRMVSEIEARTGRTITDEGRQEIADQLHVGISVIKRMEARVFDNDVSVEGFDTNREDGTSGGALPSSLVTAGGERGIEQRLDLERLMRKITCVVHECYSGRDLEIVMARIKGDMTPERYADLISRHGITVERIRQIQRGALLQIREHLASEGIDRLDGISLSA